jgi:hypothetical protein
MPILRRLCAPTDLISEVQRQAMTLRGVLWRTDLLRADFDWLRNLAGGLPN